MVATPSKQSPVSQKLAIVCALAMAASVFAGDDMPKEQKDTYQLGSQSIAANTSDAEALALIPGLIDMGNKVNAFFDRVYADILAGRVPASYLVKHPFATVGEIFSRALAEVKDLKGTGDLGPYGDKLITLLAESRHKADRNANLIRQMLVEPKPYVSSIDRKGLVALAKLSREAAASYNS